MESISYRMCTPSNPNEIHNGDIMFNEGKLYAFAGGEWTEIGNVTQPTAFEFEYEAMAARAMERANNLVAQGAPINNLCMVLSKDVASHLVRLSHGPDLTVAFRDGNELGWNGLVGRYCGLNIVVIRNDDVQGFCEVAHIGVPIDSGGYTAHYGDYAIEDERLLRVCEVTASPQATAVKVEETGYMISTELYKYLEAHATADLGTMADSGSAGGEGWWLRTPTTYYGVPWNYSWDNTPWFTSDGNSKTRFTEKKAKQEELQPSPELDEYLNSYRVLKSAT